MYDVSLAVGGMVLSLVAVVFLTIGVTVALRAVLKREPDRFIARVVGLGLLAKFVGSAARYFVMGDLYDGRGDFNRYLRAGAEIAGQIRSGTMPEQATETGTPFMEFLAGLLFAVAPTNLFIGFAVFSLLAFTGAYLFLQAFRLAIPDGDHRRYALLVMFMPTMVFWPSSLGKEAWLVFGLGAAAYGAARALRRLPHGYWILLLGSAATYQVRPHMGALFALSFAAAFLLRVRDSSVRAGGLAWIVGLVFVAVGTVFAASNFGEQVPRDESVAGSTVNQVFAETDRRTSQGGSEFDSRPVRSPGDFLHAAVTVPLRPFPHEAHNLQARLAAMEGVFLVVLLLISVPRLRSLPRELLKRPYFVLAGAYSVGFIIGFSNVGNFGILTRQRAQLLPFLAVLLAVSRVRGTRDARRKQSSGALLIAAPADEPTRDAQGHPLKEQVTNTSRDVEGTPPERHTLNDSS